jgi:hypothetical protein
MPNGLALPTRVDEIDSELQSLEFMKRSLENLEAVRGSLGEASAVLDQMKTDLKGDTLSVKDFVDLGLDAEGNFTVSLNTDKIDPSKIDLTEFPADLLSQAVDTQKALEELLNPFVASQSTLLRSLEKIQSGLTEGSKRFGEVADAIKRVHQTWDLFDAAMEDTLSSDQLIEAFDKYFSGMLDVLADTVGKIPGLGAFLQAYATAVHNIVPTMKSISAATLAKNEAIANTFTQATTGTPPSIPTATDVVKEQIESLDSRIETLNEERWNLLDSAQQEAARKAKIEIDQLWDQAGRIADRTSGWNFDEITRVLFSQWNSAYIAWPNEIRRLAANDPNDPQIAVIEAKIAKTLLLISENMRIQSTLRTQRIVELENLVRTNSHLLQEADLQELVNRFPELEQAANDVRAGNPAGTSVPVPPRSVSAVTPAGLSGKVKIAVGAGIAAVAVFGAFLFTSGGDECSTTGALTAAGVHITASSDPCPDDDADLVSVTDDTITDDPVDESLVSVTDDTITDDPVQVEEVQVQEREPAFAPLASDLVAGLDLAGATSFKWLVETVDDNAYTLSGTGGPVVIDPPGDQIYSDPNVKPFMRAAVADILVTQRLTLEAAWDLIETPLVPDGDFGCDRADELVIVVCPDSDLPFPDEPAAWTFVGMNASIPAVEGGPGEFIYSYVLDADGDPANDWQTQGPYTWDFYQGTDTWFELIRSAEDGEWRATASRVTADQQIEPIDLPFRVIIWDNIIWWWVPESSAPTDAPFRVSAFAHDGTYSPRSSSGDVPGANPTEGLLP